jgi:hypothetical protein
MRGGGGAVGRGATGATGVALMEAGGEVADADGIFTAGGGAGRAGGTITGADATGEAVTAAVGAGGATAGGLSTAGAITVRGGIGAAGAATVGRLIGIGGAAGFSTGGCSTPTCAAGGDTGRGGASGGAATSLRCVIAFSTSPGREMCDKSILVLISSSPRSPREEDFPDGDKPSPAERMYTRTFSASCSSRELECVFFSVTPTSGSVSRIALLFTSSSRARSLMRTLLIRPFVSPCCS